jgi:hypothetical protein
VGAGEETTKTQRHEGGHEELAEGDCERWHGKPPIIGWALSEGRVRPPGGLPKRGLGQVYRHLGRGHVSAMFGVGQEGNGEKWIG